MTFDPYDVLGVERTADAPAIKRAYRKRAKKAHPDAGGTADEFTRLTHSQLILLDPARRAKFDSTGTIDPTEPDNALASAVSIIVGFFNTVVQQHIVSNGADPTKVDLVAEARKAFKNNVASFEKEKQKFVRQSEKLAQVEKRLRPRPPKAGKPSPAAGMVRQALLIQINTCREPLHVIERNLQGFKDALVILDDFTFDADPPDPRPSLYVWGMDMGRTT